LITFAKKLGERGSGSSYQPVIFLASDPFFWCTYGTGAGFLTPIVFADSGGNPVPAPAPDVGRGEPTPTVVAKPDGSTIATPTGTVFADNGGDPAPAPDAGRGEQTTSVVTKPDGATITTTTSTAPDGATTRTEETKNPDGSTSSSTTTVSKTTDADGNVTTVTTGSSTDGKTGITQKSTIVRTDDKDGKMLSVRNTMSLADNDGNTSTYTSYSASGISKFTTTDKDGKATSTETTKLDGNTTTKISTDKDGNTTTTVTVTNDEGGLDTTTTTSTDKDGNTTSTLTINDKDGTGSGSNSKGKFKISKKGGGIYVEWDLPSGSGEGNWYPPGTKIEATSRSPRPTSSGRRRRRDRSCSALGRRQAAGIIRAIVYGDLDRAAAVGAGCALRGRLVESRIPVGLGLAVPGQIGLVRRQELDDLPADRLAGLPALQHLFPRLDKHIVRNGRGDRRRRRCVRLLGRQASPNRRSRSPAFPSTSMS
jgi:hypothetical protein